MHFNRHYNLEGRHAPFSPSSPAWMNYSDEKLIARLATMQAARLGTRKHDVAAELIRLRIKMPNTKATFNQYVNDGIGWKLSPEQPLYYSDNFFGTADTIGVDLKKMILRVNDLKTGVSNSTVHQLEGYAALFCLEYGFKPFELDIQLRIYQEPEIKFYQGDPDKITHIMSTITSFEKLILSREED